MPAPDSKVTVETVMGLYRKYWDAKQLVTHTYGELVDAVKSLPQTEQAECRRRGLPGYFFDPPPF